MLGVWLQTFSPLTLEYDDMHEAKLSNPAQSGLIHGIKYYNIDNFEFQL